MEKKDDQPIISDDEFIELLEGAKHKDPEAMLKLIELYKEDILRVSKYIRLPLEDAVSTIVLEFLELIQAQENG
ncbi:hypothetical protein C2I18_15620 [Paenibacillus sp. PK3_47]|uniref:hypothetical protein n=1 Tax=Paenibacillus sp. PK3_47 TaxID=2072642 RepID=UPI00201DA2AB|nr:hypothetical protein [Paenibacillus sp. PK3_47]UQZ34831.1 hypothetical protein C2I18_15620 [Paenibacillus sp. PK3_47]